MKNYIILIFSFFLIVNLNAQTYKFDIGITQELSGNEKLISKNFKLISLKDDNSTMLFYSGNIASIFDKTTKMRHEFEVNSNEKEKLKVSYLRSCNETNRYKELIDIDKEDWDFRVNKVNDSIFELNEYKRKKAKKPTRRTVIKIKESTENYINLLHKIDDRLLKLLMDKLDKNKNYTIVEVSYYFNENKGKDIKITEILNLNFEVTLPQKLNFDEYCTTHYFH